MPTDQWLAFAGTCYEELLTPQMSVTMETNQMNKSMTENAQGKCLRGMNITVNKFFSLKRLIEKVKQAGQVSWGLV